MWDSTLHPFHKPTNVPPYTHIHTISLSFSQLFKHTPVSSCLHKRQSDLESVTSLGPSIGKKMAFCHVGSVKTQCWQTEPQCLCEFCLLAWKKRVRTCIYQIIDIRLFTATSHYKLPCYIWCRERVKQFFNVGIAPNSSHFFPKSRVAHTYFRDKAVIKMQDLKRYIALIFCVLLLAMWLLLFISKRCRKLPEWHYCLHVKLAENSASLKGI